MALNPKKGDMVMLGPFKVYDMNHAGIKIHRGYWFDNSEIASIEPRIPEPGDTVLAPHGQMAEVIARDGDALWVRIRTGNGEMYREVWQVDKIIDVESKL